ncbi:HlyD family efflux transporter periplasmic adaptor subunit [Thalassotalea sp. 1_MG-2023]|uniref:HlyD family efflux transporter periplasmic adaptor subunit n=1 Tax=Thalassotalea sp. 1_MG-2023 TaxID=3062680 RepID=UPI0026E13572|nr:HlyD family efflux transporter periplasmic adaptor subunit [Thalassotalea sp. 1_MG-2023]MDO6428883.1 HlyD family efflux transporter periplasmic adaptor subunit [Thalassotalea sp. 1_MG-2023]
MTSLYNYEKDIASEIIGKQPSWIIRSGSGVLLFSILVFLFMSAYVRYPDTIQAPILVTSDIPPIRLVAKRSGYINVINFPDKGHVVKGQAIVVLESHADYQTVLLLEKQLRDFELLKGNNSFYQYKKVGDLQSSFDKFKNVLLKYELLLKNNKIHLEKKNAEKLKAKYLSLDKEFQFKLKTATEQYNLQNQRLKAHDSLMVNGSVSGNTLISIKQTVLELRSKIENIRITRKENDLILTEINQKLAKDELEFNNQKLALKYEIDIERIALLNHIQNWKQTNVLTSPIDGVVSYTRNWSRNQYVEVGQEVLIVTPFKFRVKGEMKILDRGVGKIEKNQKVFIELDSFPAYQFGQLKGVVKSISLVPDQDGYLIKINFPEQLKTTYDYDINHAPMYKGRAKIILKKRSLLSRLFDSVSYLLIKDS